MKHIFLILFLFLSFSNTYNTFAQDKKYARDVISKLSSKVFSGRGYVNNGDLKSAMYIASEFQKHGTKPIGKSYLIPFDISINTFPENVTLEIDNVKLKAGKDFFVGGGSPTSEGDFELVYLDTSGIKNALEEKTDLSNKIVVLASDHLKKDATYKLNAAGYIFTYNDKIYWRLSDAIALQPHFYFYASDSVMQNAKKATVDIQSEYYETYRTSNVIAQVEGKKYPDSTFVFTAHYDHLGMMGDVMFPGANDNASGTAMLLDMAKYYSKKENQPDYTLIFMALAAEECGLYGAKYQANNPVFPFENTKFLINLDMVGSGSEGIGMVNAKVEPKADRLIRDINETHNFFTDIRSRGARCNSDHCPFAEKGVPAIFIFTRGKEYMHYHTPDDDGPVPLTKWDELFELFNIFINKY